MKLATKNRSIIHIKLSYEKVIERYLNLCNCITYLNKNLIRQNGVFILIVHLRCRITGHFKNNDSEFSERLRRAEIAVYVNVCRLEIFNCY